MKQRSPWRDWLIWCIGVCGCVLIGTGISTAFDDSVIVGGAQMLIGLSLWSLALARYEGQRRRFVREHELMLARNREQWDLLRRTVDGER